MASRDESGAAAGAGGRLAAPRAYILCLGLATAMLGGLAEALIKLTFIKHVLQRPIRGDWQLLWMLPVGYATILAIPILALIAVPVWARVRHGRLLATATILWLGLFPLLALLRNLHAAALAVLAAGLAVVFARKLGAGGARIERGVRRVAVAGVLAPLLCAGVGYAVVGARASRAYDALPEARADLPNVVLLVWDTVRGANVGYLGYRRPTTPRLDRLARDGVSFRNAFTTAPWTLPSHGSMFTGLWTHEMTVGHLQPLVTTKRLLAEELASLGYAAGGFAANVLYAGREYIPTDGFLHYRDHRVSLLTAMASPRVIRMLSLEWRVRMLLDVPAPVTKKPAALINAQLLDWLDGSARQRGDRPFFAFLNYFDAHDPYIIPAPYDSAFGADPARSRRPFNARVDDPSEELNAYDAAIRYQDVSLGALLDSLAARDLGRPTLLIVTSDHGEHFGEHGRIQHSNSLYRELLSVPLVIHFPGRVPAGRAVHAAASLRDLPATILDLIGAGAGTLPGTSLRHHWDSTATPPPSGRPVYATEVDLRGRRANAVITDSLYFIDWQGRDIELYRFPDDTAQQHDLAELPAYAARMARFRHLSDSLNAVDRTP